MRYPREGYDDSEFPRIELRRVDASQAGDSFNGPIVIYKRKRRFTQAEKKAIWLQSSRKCHLCGKRWKLSEWGRYGWHIDHLVPNIGGGPDTEQMQNFRVACAQCNLRKGRGYRERIIPEALALLFIHDN